MPRVQCTHCSNIFDGSPLKGLASAVAGALLGAKLGSRIGIAAGPWGAFNGASAGAAVGATVGYFGSRQVYRCPSCNRISI